MKVAILTNNFPPAVDGVGDYSFNLATEFKKNGHDVLVICKKNTHLYENQSEVYPFINTWNFQSCLTLNKFLSIHKPDWLFLQYVPNSFSKWAMPIWIPLLLLMCKRYGVKISITFHEVYVRMTYWPIKYWIMAFIQRVICFFLLQIADVIITSIDFYKLLLEKYSRKSIHLIPIGSNILPVQVSDEDIIAIRKVIAPKDEDILSTFGIRNHNLLIKVYYEVCKRHPETKLLICGKLQISKELEPIYNQIRDNVYETGYLPNAEVYRMLRASDIFFLPDPVTNVFEGGTSNKSTSLAAALLARLPVVGTRGDMNNALLKQTPGVFLEDASQPVQIAERLLSILNSQQQPEAISQFFYRHLSWEATYQRYVDLCS
ncbi:glycosyltransferase family 4 protein [Spirosoma sp. SC4-14]|uniref:glycosyltransferase family 4 protein n=1 Tax=Spirosoma sp. SC4-14 TaxID=3128900 RepID=UPI0030D56788